MSALSRAEMDSLIPGNRAMAVPGPSYDDVRLAHAIAIVKARRDSSQADQELHWKKKAKILKEEVLKLRQEIQEVTAEHASLDKLPPLAPCECLFLSSKLQEMPKQTSVDELLSKASVQRFLRNAEACQRSTDKNKHLQSQLAVVIDFMVDLLGGNTAAICDVGQCSNYIHQATTFVRDAVPHLLESARHEELQVETMVQKLASSLSLNIINFSSKEAAANAPVDRRILIQQIILQLAVVPFIGQHFLVCLSKWINEISETLVCADPFHDGVAQTYDNMFFILQLFERLFADYICAWAKTKDFDEGCLQETLKYHFRTVKLFQAVQNWNSLLSFYTDQITGEIMHQLYQMVALTHKAEENKHSALAQLVEMATSEYAADGQ